MLTQEIHFSGTEQQLVEMRIQHFFNLFLLFLMAFYSVQHVAKHMHSKVKTFIYLADYQ